LTVQTDVLSAVGAAYLPERFAAVLGSPMSISRRFAYGRRILVLGSGRLSHLAPAAGSNRRRDWTVSNALLPDGDTMLETTDRCIAS
jgi:hypothetical protein